MSDAKKKYGTKGARNMDEIARTIFAPDIPSHRRDDYWDVRDYERHLY